MKIYLEREEKHLNMKIKETTVEAMLEKLNINKSTVLVVRNDELVTEKAVLKDKDDIWKVYQVMPDNF